MLDQSLKVFENEKFGKVRTTVIGGEPWFVLKDVCDSLGLSTPARVAERLEDDEVSQTHFIDALGRKQQTTIVNEAGLYNVIIRSDKPISKEFRRWITHEVIPTIRKTGGYVANDRLFIDTYLPGANQRTVMLFEAILGQVRNLNAEKAKLVADNEAMKPKAQFADKICKSHDNILLRAMAKLLCDEGFNIGEKRIFSLLRDKRVLMKNNEPYQTYVDRGYFVVDEYSYETPYGTRLGYTTKITPAGQVWLVNKCAEWHV